MPPALRPVQRRSGAGAPGLFHRTPGAVFEEASVRARALAHRHPRPPPATGGLHERGAEPFGRPQPFPPSGARQKDDEIRGRGARHVIDRKSTRLNSSHITISYAVFCLKKKTKKNTDRAEKVQTER